MYQAVLFDLDGTLAHTQIDFRGLGSALAALAHQAGIAPIPTDPLALRAALPTSWHAQADAILEYWEEKGCAEPFAIEGAMALLSALRQENKGIGIVTRNCRRIATRLLGQLALPYDTLIAREDTVRPKPFPDPVLAACKQLGVLPDQVAFVGDFWPDVAAGRAAGVALTVGIQWPHDPPDRFAPCPPHVLVASLAEAARHLR